MTNPRELLTRRTQILLPLSLARELEIKAVVEGRSMGSIDRQALRDALKDEKR